MCGIAAGSELIKTFNLYSSNLHRGCFSTGVLLVDQDFKAWVLKQKGIASLLELQKFIESNNINVRYVLMHSRAPTNTAEHTFEDNNNHPFCSDELYVAHNGIITNFKSLNKDASLKVDSSIIPNLVRKEGIHKAFEQMQGLLTCWMYDEREKEIYFVKAGSTLFYSEDGYFSSSRFENSNEVIDGSVYKLQDGSYSLVDKFEYCNPYYV